MQLNYVPNNKRITINKELCNSCKQCEADCTSLAIDIDSNTIDNSCILCGHCVAICKQQAISIDMIPPKKNDAQTITPMQFKTLCAHTRTCRNYKSQVVPQHIIDEIIANSSLYPSASNTRSVQITAITDTSIIEALNNAVAQRLLQLFSFYSNPFISIILKPFISSKELRKLSNYKNLFVKKMEKHGQNITYKAPIVFIFHAKKTISGMQQTDADIWATYTSLLCSTYGLGTCFNGFIVKALEKDVSIKSIIGIPKDHTVYISLLAGYPKYTYTNEPGRK